MTFAAIPWLSISINLLLVIFVIVCLLMTLLILMQRPKQEGLGAAFGGGVTDQVFGARTTNVLQRGTVYCGTLFFLLALLLAILIGHQNKDSALLKKDKPAAEEVDSGAGQDSPGSDAKPAGGDMPSSLLEEIPVETPGPVEQPQAPGENTTEGAEAPQPAEPEGADVAPQPESAPVEQP